ncbi:MAG: tripartite ATP-independent periplasmic transporter solute receptor, DctP family [Peptococcaceae bacterium]|jgi:tripartite ATP-independent transporter DctP family solute receptor|nr:tripartite ATP-independent periplasmic transporter solute receptor, DctP family [Peptococcaceae bacterium]
MKKFLVWTLIVLFVFSLAGCSSGQKAPEKPKEGEKYLLKLGHVANPANPYAQAAERLAQLVKERTNGNVEIQVFPSSQLGDQRDLLEGLQLGTVDATVTSSAVLAQFAPKAQVIDLPYLFRDKQHVYKVVDGPLAQEIFAGLDKVGMVYMSTWENGFRHLTNSKHPITKPEDMKGLKIRVMENKVYIEMMKALGANPTPMAMGEVFTALQQKTVDAQENPISQIFASRFYEVQKYLTLDGHTYSPSVVVFSKKTIDKLPKEYVDIIKKTAEEVRDWERKKMADDEAMMLDTCKKNGMEIIELTPEQKKAFADAMKPVWAQFENVVGKDLIEKILATK